MFYPENNPGSADGVVPYPYAVRGHAGGNYVINAGFPNAWNGIDLSGDDVVVRKVAGAFFDHAIAIGPGRDGRIEGVLSNGNAVTRVGYQQPYWMNEGSIFELVIDKYMRKTAKIVTVDGARGLTLLNVFAYGFHDGLVVNSGQVDAFNLGTDNLGTDGHTVQGGQRRRRGDQPRPLQRRHPQRPGDATQRDGDQRRPAQRHGRRPVVTAPRRSAATSPNPAPTKSARRSP